jgi:hypothetical protein
LARAGAAADDRKDRPRAGRAALMLGIERKNERTSAKDGRPPLRETAPGKPHASTATSASDGAEIAFRNIVNLKNAASDSSTAIRMAR